MRILFFTLICLLMFSQSAEAQTLKQYSQEEVDAEARFVEGVSLMILNKYDQAIEIFEKLWKKDDQEAGVAFQLSRCYEATKDYDKAAFYGQKAVNLDPSNEFYTMQLAESYEAEDLWYKAAETYESYTKIEPEDDFFYTSAAGLYLKDGNLDAAIKVLNKLEKEKGVNELLSRQKYEIYQQTGNNKAAIKELQNLADAFPENSRYLENVASYYLQIGQIKNAESTYKSLLKKDPENVSARQYFNSSKTDRNSSNSYVEVLKTDIQKPDISFDDKIVRTMYVVSQLAIEPNPSVNQEIISITENLTDMYPLEAKAFAIHGDALLLNNQIEPAILAYQKTIQLDGSVFEVWSQLLFALKDSGQNDQLLNWSDRALLRFPNQALIFLFNGYASNQLNKPSEAINVLKEGSFMTGNNQSLKSDILTELSRSYMLSNDNDKAQETLNKAQELNPNNVYMMQVQGDLFLAQGQKKNAIKTWENALKLDPKNSNITERINRNK